jgi:hypothetical protein
VHPTPDLLTHRADAKLVPVFKLQHDAVGIFLVGYLAEAEVRHAASLVAASRESSAVRFTACAAPIE